MSRDAEWTTIETPVEASAALAVLMVGVDGVGTLEEGRFLTERASSLPVFAGMNRAQFFDLLADVTGRVWSSHPVREGGFDEEALSGLIGKIRNALPESLRGDALRMTADLAWCDGYSYREHALLARLRAGLGMGRA